MSVSNESKTTADDGRTLLALWVGAFAPLVAWGLHLSGVSLFAPLWCETEDRWGLPAITLLALVIDGIGGVMAWRCYRPTLGRPASADVKRRRYFGLVGMLGSAIFGSAIVVQALTLAAVC